MGCRWRGGSGLGLVGGALVLPLAVTTLVPFLYMIATALMDEFEVLRYPTPLVPAQPHPENFAAALTALPFDRFFLTTAIFSVGVVPGQDVTSTMAAYAFARLPFPGRAPALVLYLSVALVPGAVLLIRR